jgi:hypothetical protein
LSFEQNEITASLGLLVDHTFFELLKSVDNFEEIAMVKEEPEISAFTFSNNSFNRE